MANYLICLPHLHPHVVSVDYGLLGNILGDGASQFSHSCSADDPCRGSVPCLSGGFLSAFIEWQYGIRSEICKYQATYGRNVRIPYSPLEADDRVTLESKDGDALFTPSNHGDTFTLSGCKDELRLKDDVIVKVSLRLLGGKGGFGALLKVKGKRKKQSSNIDSCRTLAGERIRHTRLKELSQRNNENKVDLEATKLPRTKGETDEEEAVSKGEGHSNHMKHIQKESKRVKETVARGLRNRETLQSQATELATDKGNKLEQMLKDCLDIYEI